MGRESIGALGLRRRPWPLTAEQVERSAAPALSVPASGDRSIRTGIEALAAEGILNGVSVAVHASSDGADQLELARQVLDELGVDVASQTVATALSSGSGGPGKWHIDDSLPAVLTWDAATGTFVSR